MTTIDLSEQPERIVPSLVEAGRFSSADEVIDEALRLVGEVYRQADERTADQLENLRRLGEKLDAMPVAAVTDALTNRDHDRMLYGK